jgi:hypothetical protein
MMLVVCSVSGEACVDGSTSVDDWGSIAAFELYRKSKSEGERGSCRGVANSAELQE